MAFSAISNIGVVWRALTPEQKYAAVRRLSRESHWDLMTNKWFILFGASVIFLLSIVLLAVRRIRVERKMEESERKFNFEANRKGLTAEEREILSGISVRASLKLKNAIFTLPAVFDRGAAKLMQEMFTAGQNIADRKRLNMSVNSIKAKLGFEKSSRVYGVSRGRRKSLSSRGLEEGRKVWIAPKGKSGVTRIEAVVAKNDEHELVLRSEIAVLSVPGDMWNVQYRVGSAVWEFDALTMVCGVDGLELNHSDNVRYSNRRRFNRAAINRPGLVSKFPVLWGEKSMKLRIPAFTDCTITEISGVGLRIKTDLELAFGERILIMFELEEGKQISDIAEVRGARDTALGHSIGIEMTGVDESGVDELVRVTNAAAAVAEHSKSDWEVSAEDAENGIESELSLGSVND